MRARLYHLLLVLMGISLFLLGGCAAPQKTQAVVMVSLAVDGRVEQLQLPAGSTAQDAYTRAGVELGPLDRSDPPLYTLLSDGASLRLIRLSEEFEVEQVILPFEKQVVLNETLPEGETRLSQAGQNGAQEITYRILYEDGVEMSRTAVKLVVVKEPSPEIVMVGSQTPFLSVKIPGRLAFLLGGNAWAMETSTGNRRPLITTGDLDGRVFDLSPDGKWLLFTRSVKEEDAINRLWAVRLEPENSAAVDLKITNVIHFAGWSADSATFAYSTVEPRSTAPGWQANNDLNLLSVSSNGLLSRTRQPLEANSGGVYGWWGMNFIWGPRQTDNLGRLAYSRPDSVGLVDPLEGELTPLMELLPLQTGGDWAWVPGVSWAPDGGLIFSVAHIAPTGSENPEQSTQFDLVALPPGGGAPIRIVSQVGMFAYPVASPLQTVTEAQGTVVSYQVAYLQAIAPDQSETSRYRLVVMDRDGSNRRLLFPAEGVPGLAPQQIVWAPEPLLGDEMVVALLYQDNIWLVNVETGQAQQITGDGFITRLDWR